MPWLPQRGELAAKLTERGIAQQSVPKRKKFREVGSRSMAWGPVSYCLPWVERQLEEEKPMSVRGSSNMLKKEEGNNGRGYRGC